MTIVRFLFLSTVISCLLGGPLDVPAHAMQQPREQVSSSDTNNDKYPCVVIAGAVRTPTRVEMRRRVRLSELIIPAGGFTNGAGSTVKIIHRPEVACREITPNELNDKAVDSRVLKLEDVIRGDEESNLDLQPGDVVLVQEADFEYVVGNIMKPQSLVLKPGMTVTQAIAMAGGVLSHTRTNRIRLIRQAPGSTTKTEIMIDLKAIRKHRAADLELQANDIIDVPSKHNHPGHGALFGAGHGALFGVSFAYLPIRVVN